MKTKLDTMPPADREELDQLTDDALIDRAIACMPPTKMALKWEQLTPGLKDALERRFGSRTDAKEKVQLRIRRLKYQEKWPPDWPDRVDPQPLFDKLAGTQKEIGPRDQKWLRRLCAQAKESGMPPKLNAEEKARLGQYCSLPIAYDLMGLPYFRREGDLRYMISYWAANGEEDREQSGHTEEETARGECGHRP